MAPLPEASACPVTSDEVHRYAPGSGRTVALTFDDGPGTSTSQILSILMTYAVRGTFFNLGAQMAAHPSLLRSELQQGHTLGNHTWDHPDLPNLTASQQASELDRTTAEQVSLTGQAPCLFRPPYGNLNAATLALAAARGLGVWNWSVDPEDWKAKGSASSYWVNRITTRAEAGLAQQHPVVLFHNASGPGDAATVAALPHVIMAYRSHGYAFVDLLGHLGFAPYAPHGSPALAVAPTAAGLHVFWRDSNGHLQERTRAAGAWSGTTALGGTTAFGPAAAELDNDKVVVAITDSNDRVNVRTVGDRGTGAWTNLGGVVSSRPAVTVDRRDGTVTVAARSATGALVYRQRIAGRWGAWGSLGGAFVTAPSVTATPGGALSVIQVGADGALWARHSSSAGWAAWRRVGGLALSADPALIVAPDDKHLLAFGRDTTGAVRVLQGSLDCVSWGTWRSLGGVVASGPSATVSAATITMGSVGTNGYGYLDTGAYGGTSTAWSGWGAVRL